MSPGDHALAAFAILAPTSVDCWLHQEKVSTGTAYCQPGKENPFGPRILVTTLAVSLLILGSSAEVTPAPAEVVLLSPLGKQQTTSTRVAVVVAPGASSPPEPQKEAWLQVSETKLN